MSYPNYRCYSCDEYAVPPDANGERSDDICSECHAGIERQNAECEQFLNSLPVHRKMARNIDGAVRQVVNHVRFRLR
jgi:hypothetical protein